VREWAPERPGKRRYRTRYLYPGDGWKYWAMTTVQPGTGQRHTADLLIIAREMQRVGAGIRSLAEPFLDTNSDFAEIVFAILGVAAKLERRCIVERTARGRADAKAKGVKFGRKPKLPAHQQREAQKRICSGRDATQRRSQLQCQSEHHFPADLRTRRSNG
jgi:hypothetical protein